MAGRKTSVALRYDERMPAPLVVARGKGDLARRLEDVARECDIPVVEAAQLAETLYVVEPGESIPEEFYEVVAEILGFIWRTSSAERQKKVWDEEHQGE